MMTALRLHQLTDNIRQDLNLLKEYEDELRYETDPGLRGKYRRRIERYRESLTRYQREYDELCKQVTGEPPAEMVDTADLLRQMNVKLDGLLIGQETIRNALLDRFDASEQTIITAIVQQLDENQLATVQTILDEIETHRVPEDELQETLTALQQALAEISQDNTGHSQLVREAKNLSAVVDNPKLDVNQKLKVSVPIIPLILSYEAEVGLKSGLDLKAAWLRLKARVRGT